MPRDLLLFADGRARIDLDLLHSEFLSRLLDVLAACRARGADYFVTSGTRLWDEQAALYAKYRVGGPRAARPGLSAHQFGIAVDVARDGNLKTRGLQPVYRAADYAILIEEVERAGLHSGHKYKDRPHVSLAGYVTAKDLLPLRRAWLRSKGDTATRMKDVWAHVVQRAA